jgi:DEAD/DEAH box helicase domain-containing protein
MASYAARNEYDSRVGTHRAMGRHSVKNDNVKTNNQGSSIGQSLLNRVLAGLPADAGPLTHLTELSARAAATSVWPALVSPTVVRALQDSGVHVPWTHQAVASSLALSGSHVIVATGTASGKSLAYQLPVLTTLAADPSATAIYLAPTKALTFDQLRSVLDLTETRELQTVFPAAYDGDTSAQARQWTRSHARWLFTNPDMLHHEPLRSHQRWGRFWRGLRYVVVDEAHCYRGVFGSNVALILRRLRRVAARYGADPVFILASATSADPAETAQRLIGAPCVAVTEDGSPRGARTIALWEPPLTEARGENQAPVRRSASAEAARVLAALVAEGARTLAFVRSRYGAEVTALTARTLLGRIDPDLAARVESYRGGYLAEDRRALESALADGRLLGVATTNALELGVDIAGLDAIVMAGFPGTVASFWQQAGRAGRETQSSLVVLIARDDPLDTYLVHHPAALLDRPVEATVIDPANPSILGPQLLCAAAELPLTDEEVRAFGAAEVLAELAERGLIRRRPHGWFTPPDVRAHANIDIRGSGGSEVAVVESATGRMLGTSDGARATATLHPGAVHLHRGETFVVDELDLEAGVALVHAETPDWTTTARRITRLAVDEVLERADHGEVVASLARVQVTSQVIGYARIALSGRLLEVVELDLPAQTLTTKAVMYTATPALLAAAGVPGDRIAGALHAAEHAAIGLLPLIATCDRGDVGGLSTARHADTDLPTVFVYDGHPGGAGFADRGYARLRRWLTATMAAIQACECPVGCPSCVQSATCGNGNQPLDKRGAGLMLSAVLDALAG